MKKMIGLTLALSLLVSLCPMAMAMDFLNLRMFQNFTYEEDVHVIGNAPNGMGTNGVTNGNYLVCKDTEPDNKYAKIEAFQGKDPILLINLNAQAQANEKNLYTFKIRPDNQYGAKRASLRFNKGYTLFEFRNNQLFVRGDTNSFTKPVMTVDFNHWYSFYLYTDNTTYDYSLFCDDVLIETGNFLQNDSAITSGQRPVRFDFQVATTLGTPPEADTTGDMSIDDFYAGSYTAPSIELSRKLTGKTTAFDTMSNEYLTLLFSSPIDESTLTKDNIIITDAAGTVVSSETYKLTYDGSALPKKLYILLDDTPLTLNTKYTITVSNVKDGWGADIAQYQAEFTTQAEAGKHNYIPYTDFTGKTQTDVNKDLRTWLPRGTNMSVISDTDNEGNTIQVADIISGAVVGRYTEFTGTCVLETTVKFLSGNTGNITVRPRDGQTADGLQHTNVTLIQLTNANNGTIKLNNAITVMTNAYDKYLNLRFVFDNDRKLVDMYIDGNLVASKVQIQSAFDFAENFTNFRFNPAGSSIYVKDFELYHPARGTITYNEGASMDPMAYLNFTIDDNVNPDSVNKGSFAIDNGATIGSVTLADKSVSVEFAGGLDYDKTYTITALDSISNLIGIPAKGTGSYQLTTPQENSDVTGIRYKYGTEEVQNIRPGELTAEVDLDLTSSSAKKKVTFILAVYDKINNTLLDVDVVATNYDGFTSPTVSLTTTVPAEGTYYAKVIMLKNFDSMKPFSLTGFKTVLE